MTLYSLECADVSLRIYSLSLSLSQPAQCFVLADVREHATCAMGASGNSDNITISS